MSTITEIEAALPHLSEEELKRVEAAVERVRREHEQLAQPGRNSRLEAFLALKASLALDDRKMNEWKATIRDARR